MERIYTRVLVIIIAVISTASHLTDTVEHTTLYKMNKNVCIKTSKHSPIIVFLAELFPSVELRNCVKVEMVS